MGFQFTLFLFQAAANTDERHHIFKAPLCSIMRPDIFCFVSKSNSSDAYRSRCGFAETENAFFKTLALAREREKVMLLGRGAFVNRN